MFLSHSHTLQDVQFQARTMALSFPWAVPRTESAPRWGCSGFLSLGEVVMANRTRKVNTGQIIELLRENLCGPVGKRPHRSLTESEQERQKDSQEAGPGDGMGT